MTLWPIADVVPHSGDMSLLDRMIELDAERIVCTTTIRAGGLFSDADGGFPAWAGVELMAQSVAAWAGAHSLNEQKPIRLGFLLGTRHYKCNVDRFPAGCTLRIEAERVFHDESGMGSFACRIEAAGIEANARLSVFSPPDADLFFTQTAAVGTQGISHD
ncbi:hotdog family protein [Dyella sp. GSA-30]|uniref:hotdog family protein n=1 Tax=Dyella sp. GSA-30 TaxID=2994496 RepID=UPI00248F5B24|nr:hotdog family protein [Dyella sp. GSA-30]BDU22485.1 3-hydroxylacyl-ACP dehydratase [Dyella sp. GSA-30]